MAKIKENIAFIIPALTGGGAERVISTLSYNMPEEKNVNIIIYKDSDRKYPHKGNVINLNSRESNNVFGKGLNTLIRIYKIKHIKKKLKIDKTISFMENPNIINIFSRYKDKVIISIRNQKSKEIYASHQYLQKKLIEKIYNKSDKIIAISEGVKEDLIDNFNIDRRKIEVIYNPVDIKYIDSMKNKEIGPEYEGIFNNGKVIITSGRLTYQKGQWYLIRSFRKIKQSIPEAKLVILGEGELKDKLKSIVKTLGLEDSVYFLGFQANPFKYIKNSDIFVLPSLFEGFGNVITESMQCGTIVISTDCKSGPKEILNPHDINQNVDKTLYGDYGILVPNFDGHIYDGDYPLTKEEEILADSIIKVLKNDSLRKNYEQKLKRRVYDFNVSEITSKWCRL